MLREKVKLQFSSNPELSPLLRRIIKQSCHMIGLGDTESHMVTLAADEGFTNIIRHTYKMATNETIWLNILMEDQDFIEITFLDQGPLVDLSAIKARELENVKPGGLGTHFISSIMDEAEYLHSKEGGNILRMRKHVSSKRVTCKHSRQTIKNRKLLETLLNINQSLHQILDLEEVLQVIVNKTHELIQSEGTAVILLDEDNHELFFHTVRDEDEDVVKCLSKLRFPAHEGIAGRVMKTGKPVLIDDVKKHPGHFRKIDEQTGSVTHSILYAPLKVRERIIGILSARNKKHSLFTLSDLDMLTAIAGTVSLSIDNARAHEALASLPDLSETRRIRKEIDAARLMHGATLPQDLPDIEGLSLSATCDPAHEVGGDYYDFFTLSDTLYAIAVGDVSGHGMEAGIMVSMAHSCLFTQIGFSFEIASVMSAMNRMIYGSVKRRLIMTFFFSIYDTQSRLLTFANAGHPSPYYYSNAKQAWEYIEEGEFPLGVFEEHTYKVYQWQLSPGDILILYSDGIIEAANPEGERYGFARFEKLLTSREWHFPRQVENALLEDVSRFCRRAAPGDDRTLLVIFVEEENEQEASR